MTYTANPITVEAYDIVDYSRLASGEKDLTLSDGKHVIATAGMLANAGYIGAGDFYVVREDGSAYVAQREVFLRKHSRLLTADR